jgi:hypothetical protein
MADAMTPNETVIPTERGDVHLYLRVPKGGTEANTVGDFRFDVLDQNGDKIRHREGPINPHLSAAEKQVFANAVGIALAKIDATFPAPE